MNRLLQRLRPFRTAGLFALLATVVVAAVCLGGPLWRRAGLARVEAAIRRHDWPAALEALDRLEHAWGKIPESDLLRGRVLRRQGRMTEAEECFAAAAAWDAEAVRRQRLLAQAQTNGSRRVQPELTNLLATGGDNAFAEECYEAMTRGFIASFRLDEAARCLKFWSEWQRDDCQPWLWQGLLQERLERPGLALDAYRTAWARDPSSYEALVNVARLELETGRLDEAAAHYRECHDRRPDEPDAALGLASCLMRSGDVRGAAALLRQALTLDIDPARMGAALADLGQMAIEEGDLERAGELYRQAVALDPDSPRVRQGLAAVLSRYGRDAEAAEHRAAAQTVGELRRRLTAVTRRCVGEPDNADLRTEAGRILLEAQSFAEARRWLETALDIAPEHEEARQLLARCVTASPPRGDPPRDLRGDVTSGKGSE